MPHPAVTSWGEFQEKEDVVEYCFSHTLLPVPLSFLLPLSFACLLLSFFLQPSPSCSLLLVPPAHSCFLPLSFSLFLLPLWYTQYPHLLLTLFLAPFFCLDLSFAHSLSFLIPPTLFISPLSLALFLNPSLLHYTCLSFSLSLSFIFSLAL